MITPTATIVAGNLSELIHGKLVTILSQRAATKSWPAVAFTGRWPVSPHRPDFDRRTAAQPGRSARLSATVGDTAKQERKSTLVHRTSSPTRRTRHFASKPAICSRCASPPSTMPANGTGDTRARVALRPIPWTQDYARVFPARWYRITSAGLESIGLRSRRSRLTNIQKT